MNKLLFALGVAAMSACLALPAQANPLSNSQWALTAVEAADAYTISRYTWQGDAAYDKVAPMCARTAIREFACQAVANLVIRHFEKPSKGTIIANYIASAVYAMYIHKAIGAMISIRF